MDGIVLSRRDIREYDQIISIYTEDAGKIELIARGVKKIVSKNAASLEPCSFIRFGVAQGKELDYLTTVNIIEYFSTMRQDVLKSWQAWFFTEAMGNILERGVPEAQVFKLLLQYLTLLNEQPKSRPIFLDIVFLKFFHFLGYTPVLSHCVNCNKLYNGNETFFFHPASGGVLCLKCREEKKSPPNECLPITVQEVSLLQHFLVDPLFQELGEKMPGDRYRGMHRLIYAFISYYSEKRLPDWGKTLALVTS